MAGGSNPRHSKPRARQEWISSPRFPFPRTLSSPPASAPAIPTGIAIALPEGYEAQVRPRSGLALHYGVTVLNAPGTIDADYRGEIKVILVNHGTEPFTVSRGDRIAQLVVAPVTAIALEEVESSR